MNYEVTNELINELKSYITSENIKIITDDKDKSDYVIIDEKNNVGFEVMENEIIVFFFTDHRHFNTYSTNSQDNNNDYIKQAKIFLSELFSYEIKHIEIYKGKKLTSEKHFIIYPDNRAPFDLGTIIHLFSRSVNPFLRRTETCTIWHYDRSKGYFTYDAPKNPNPNAIEVIAINDDCYIEIFEKHGTYTFEIMKMYYDEYSGSYWAPAINAIPSGIYDTKETAIKYSMEAVKTYDMF